MAVQKEMLDIFNVGREFFEPSAAEKLLAEIEMQFYNDKDMQVVDIDSLRKYQEEDPCISKVLSFIKDNKRPTRNQRKGLDRETTYILHQWNRLIVTEDGILLRELMNHKQIVLPKKLRQLVYTELHEKMGHLSTERVVLLARERFYWPNLEQDIHLYITQSCGCLKNKRPHNQVQAPLQELSSSSPGELVGIDLVHLEKAVGGYEYILTITDHFTRFLQTYPLRNKEAKTVAKHLFFDFMQRFGSPVRLLHDQGTEFENKLFEHLRKLMGVSRSRTTPYHPQGNGQCERMNKTILQMLRTLEESQKRNWPQHLNPLTHAYNCTRNSATGFSPYFLMFGRHPTLPIDLILNSSRKKPTTHKDYVEKWAKTMEEAYTIASQNYRKQQQKDQARRNSKSVLGPLSAGDKVRVKNVRERGGPGKLRSYWEKEIYTVISRRGGEMSVVYDVHRPEKPDEIRTLHRNMLLDVSNLPIAEQPEQKAHQKKSQPREAYSLPTDKDMSVSHDDTEIESVGTSGDLELCPNDLQAWQRMSQAREYSDITLHTQSREESDVRESIGLPDRPVEQVIEENVEDEMTVGTTEVADQEDADIPFELDDSENDSSRQEEVRRSGRNRRGPMKLTYDTIGGVPRFERKSNVRMLIGKFENRGLKQ